MTTLSGKTPNRTHLWGNFGLVVEWARPGPSKAQLGPHPTDILIWPRVNLDVGFGTLIACYHELKLGLQMGTSSPTSRPTNKPSLRHPQTKFMVP